MHRKPVHRAASFWSGFLGSSVLLGILFLWQLGKIPSVWSPPRMEATVWEYWFAIALLLLLSTSTGLFLWHREHRSCPVGTKRAGGIAGVIGAITLICPACTTLPIALLGAGVSLSVLGPFVPLLRIIALLIAAVTTALLWPRSHS